MEQGRKLGNGEPVDRKVLGDPVVQSSQRGAECLVPSLSCLHVSHLWDEGGGPGGP